jgi:uncharacterized protein
MNNALYKSLKYLILSAFFVYGAGMAYLYTFQRSYVFRPNAPLAIPDKTQIPTAILKTFETADGEKVVSWWIPPQKQDAPILIFFHGNADNLSRFNTRFALLTREGLGLVALSYRGYGGSSGKPTEASFHQDALALYRMVRAEYPERKIFVWGYSLGSSVATHLAAKLGVSPEIGALKGLILEAPFSSALALAKQQYPYFPVSWLMRDPFRSDLAIPKIKAPLIVFHGTADTTVAYSEGQYLFSLAPHPKEFKTFEGAAHDNLATYGALEAAQVFMAR